MRIGDQRQRQAAWEGEGGEKLRGRKEVQFKI